MNLNKYKPRHLAPKAFPLPLIDAAEPSGFLLHLDRHISARYLGIPALKVSLRPTMIQNVLLTGGCGIHSVRNHSLHHHVENRVVQDISELF